MGDRVGIYARISDDREGAGLGVARQVDDCRQKAEQLRWTVADTYVDNDLSAYGAKVRPEYDRMCADVRAGRLDAIIVWHTDRLHRNTRQFEDFVDLITAAKIPVETVRAGTLDLSSATGRAAAKTAAVWAQHESEHRAERIRRKARELAENGKLGGGGHRPFGYQREKDARGRVARETLNEDEAAVVREVAQRLLGGDSLRGVCADLQARGVVNTTGKPLVPFTLRRMILSPRIAGYRQHTPTTGKASRAPGTGDFVAKAEWPAIIDRETAERLRAVLLTPERRMAWGGGQRKYLLTGGIAVCALCGSNLIARPRRDQRQMVCATGPGFNGCGKIRRQAEPLEEFVAESIFAALDTPTLVAALRDVTDDGEEGRLHTQLAADQEALQDLALARFVRGDVDQANYLAAKRALDDRIEATKRSLSRATGSRVLIDLPTGAEAVRGVWQARGLDWRRSLVSLVLAGVVVEPALVGRNFFDPDCIRLVWRA